MYGKMVGDVMVLTDRASGKLLVETEAPECPKGYNATYTWFDGGDSYIQTWALEPEEGTAEEAALNLSRLQFMSLPDEAAYQFRALAPEWVAGETYYGADDESTVTSRVRYAGGLYRCEQTHVAQEDNAPGADASPWCDLTPAEQDGEAE